MYRSWQWSVWSVSLSHLSWCFVFLQFFTPRKCLSTSPSSTLMSTNHSSKKRWRLLSWKRVCKRYGYAHIQKQINEHITENKISNKTLFCHRAHQVTFQSEYVKKAFSNFPSFHKVFNICLLTCFKCFFKLPCIVSRNFFFHSFGNILYKKADKNFHPEQLQ